MHSTPTALRWTTKLEGLGSTRGRPRLLAVGRLVERKGLDLAVRALVEPPRRRARRRRRPAGRPLRTGGRGRRLRALVVAEVGVGGPPGADRPATWHGAVPAIAASADVVLAVPWYEPFGHFVPVEADGVRPPVVGTPAVGGLLDTGGRRRDRHLVLTDQRTCCGSRRPGPPGRRRRGGRGTGGDAGTRACRPLRLGARRPTDTPRRTRRVTPSRRRARDPRPAPGGSTTHRPLEVDRTRHRAVPSPTRCRPRAQGRGSGWPRRS